MRRTPENPVVGFVIGGAFLIMGIGFEALTRPIVPFYQAIGSLMTAIGVAAGLGVAAYRLPGRWVLVPRVVQTLGMIYQIVTSQLNDLSFLFPAVFEGVYRITCSAMLLMPPEETPKPRRW